MARLVSWGDLRGRERLMKRRMWKAKGRGKGKEGNYVTKEEEDAGGRRE